MARAHGGWNGGGGSNGGGYGGPNNGWHGGGGGGFNRSGLNVGVGNYTGSGGWKGSGCNGGSGVTVSGGEWNGGGSNMDGGCNGNGGERWSGGSNGGVGGSNCSTNGGNAVGGWNGAGYTVGVGANSNGFPNGSNGVVGWNGGGTNVRVGGSTGHDGYKWMKVRGGQGGGCGGRGGRSFGYRCTHSCQPKPSDVGAPLNGAGGGGPNNKIKASCTNINNTSTTNKVRKIETKVETVDKEQKLSFDIAKLIETTVEAKMRMNHYSNERWMKRVDPNEGYYYYMRCEEQEREIHMSLPKHVNPLNVIKSPQVIKRERMLLKQAPAMKEKEAGDNEVKLKDDKDPKYNGAEIVDLVQNSSSSTTEQKITTVPKKKVGVKEKRKVETKEVVTKIKCANHGDGKVVIKNQTNCSTKTASAASASSKFVRTATNKGIMEKNRKVLDDDSSDGSDASHGFRRGGRKSGKEENAGVTGLMESNKKLY